MDPVAPISVTCHQRQCCLWNCHRQRQPDYCSDHDVALALAEANAIQVPKVDFLDLGPYDKACIATKLILAREMGLPIGIPTIPEHLLATPPWVHHSMEAIFYTQLYATAMAKQSNKELFWRGLVKVLEEQHQVDVRLKARDSTMASIPAHKLFLSARSEVFKKILESDNLKASDGEVETITLSELKHEELEALVEFIYSDGSILSKKAKQHVRSLYIAADKYEIPHLRDLCREELILTLNSSTSLDILLLAEIPFDKSLSDLALATIKENKSKISKSDELEVFVTNHPNLALKIIKAISIMKCPNCRMSC